MTTRHRPLGAAQRQRLRIAAVTALIVGACSSSAPAQRTISGQAIRQPLVSAASGNSVGHRPSPAKPLSDPQAVPDLAPGSGAAPAQDAAPPGEPAPSSDVMPQDDSESSMQLAPPANEAHLLFLEHRDPRQPDVHPPVSQTDDSNSPTDGSRLIITAKSWESCRDYRTQMHPALLQQPSLSSATVAQLFRAWNVAGSEEISEAVTRIDVVSNTPAAQGARPHQAGVTAQNLLATSEGYLRTTTPSSRRADAQQQLAQAMHEYSVRAWASSEQSAWQTLRIAAESVDLANAAGGAPCRDAQSALADARDAIHEATHFSGCYGDTDPEAIARLVQSHRTPVLHGQPLQSMTASEATDRYLNEARVKLSSIAAESVEAAQAMDLLAAVYLSRGDAATLPSSTALCLRRAALQGQPENPHLAAQLGRHLAAMDLLEEAKRVLEHSLALQPNEEIAATLQQVLQRSGAIASAKPLARVPMSSQARPSGGFAPVSRRTFASGTTLPVKASPATTSTPVRFASPATLPSATAVPEVIRLTPREYAVLSKPILIPPRDHAVPPGRPASTIARRGQASRQPSNADKSRIRKVVESLGNLW